MYTDQILKDLKSNDPQLQDSAIRQLKQTGSDEAIQILAECLNYVKWREKPEWRGPSQEAAEGRVIYEPLSFLAAEALASIIPAAPRQPERLLTAEFVIQMKLWWEQNKDHYQQEDKSI